MEARRTCNENEEQPRDRFPHDLITQMERHHESDEEVVHPRDLPYDIITQHILTRLPIKPLIRFKSVSKQWYSTISSPHFAHAHFHFPHPSSPIESLIIQSSNNKFQLLSYNNNDQNAQIAQIVDVDFDVGEEKLVLVGCSNGLVCLGSTSGCLFIIWNPITHKFQKYYDREIYDDFTKKCMVTWGFGYVSAIDDYKIVRILKEVFCPSYRIHVFSIKLNKWKRIDLETRHDFTYLRIAERLRKPGVLVNETLYWLGGLPPMLEGLDRKILSFDLALELFGTFPHLDVSSPTSWNTFNERGLDYFLLGLNGCLAKYGCVFSGGGVITVLKRPGQTEEILIPRELLYGGGAINLIGFTSTNMFFKLEGAGLAVIDPSSRPMKQTPLITFERTSEIVISSYFPTLIPIGLYSGRKNGETEKEVERDWRKGEESCGYNRGDDKKKRWRFKNCFCG